MLDMLSCIRTCDGGSFAFCLTENYLQGPFVSMSLQNMLHFQHLVSVLDFCKGHWLVVVSQGWSGFSCCIRPSPFFSLQLLFHVFFEMNSCVAGAFQPDLGKTRFGSCGPTFTLVFFSGVRHGREAFEGLSWVSSKANGERNVFEPWVINITLFFLDIAFWMARIPLALSGVCSL